MNWDLFFPLYLMSSVFLSFPPAKHLSVCVLTPLSDLSKHIWHTLIRLALADSLSLSLFDRTEQCISFCALLWSALLAALFYLPGLCHAHLHSALLGCSALWESCVALALGQQVGKALLGFSNWPPTLLSLKHCSENFPAHRELASFIISALIFTPHIDDEL